MSQNYLKIRNDYLHKAWARSPEVLSVCLPAELTAAGLRFQALLLRADLAVSLNELVEGRGVLAEARQIRLSADEREALAPDLRRADDLESFFTHRGCAG